MNMNISQSYDDLCKDSQLVDLWRKSVRCSGKDNNIMTYIDCADAISRIDEIVRLEEACPYRASDVGRLYKNLKRNAEHHRFDFHGSYKELQSVLGNRNDSVKDKSEIDIITHQLHNEIFQVIGAIIFAPLLFYVIDTYVFSGSAWFGNTAINYIAKMLYGWLSIDAILMEIRQAFRTRDRLFRAKDVL